MIIAFSGCDKPSGYKDINMYPGWIVKNKVEGIGDGLYVIYNPKNKSKIGVSVHNIDLNIYEINDTIKGNP